MPTTRRPASARGASIPSPGPGEPGGNTWPSDGDAYQRGGGSIWVTGTYDPAAEPGLLRHRQPRARLLQQRARRRQPLHRVARRARRRHRQAALALSVHAARRARLGLDPGAGARRPDDQRPAAQGRDVRQPQRVLLHARSRHRQGDRRQAVRRDDVGQGNRRRRPAGAAAGPSAGRRRHRRPVPISAAAPTSCRRPTIRRPRLFFVTARETCATYFAYDQKFKRRRAVHGRRRRRGRAIRRTSARCARSIR